jgi:polyhydroxybutyrate depolymerase
MKRPSLVLLAALVVRCSAPPPAPSAPPATSPPPASAAVALTPVERALLADRPYRLVIPSGYDGTADVPFVVLLHGYTATGQLQDDYFQLSALAEARTFLLATPDGLVDTAGEHYWNATDACCGAAGTQKTDDVAYLTAILDDVQSRYRVDSKRVFFIGHSNGGFMSHRMACDRASRIAGIASLAGAQWKDVTHCEPGGPVTVLEIHGTLDALITYQGGDLPGAAYPGAPETVGDWAALDGCAAVRSMSGADLDADLSIPGAETLREGFTACPSGFSVELWSIQGGSHVPTLTAGFTPAVYDFLMAHPKP